MIGVALLVGFSLAAIRFHRLRADADISDGQKAPSITISSSSFVDGSRIPQRFTCDGEGLSPEIQLPLPPAGTKGFALVMDDPDASGFVHWLVYNIPIDTRDIPEGASSRLKLPAGAVEGTNSLNKVGYFGPCPPGTKAHHYIFRLYALDVDLDLPAGQTKKQLAAAVEGHMLGEGQMTGLYTRAGR